MKEYKLLITGTVGAGKTTAIRAISDIEPVVTDVANHDSAVDKARTTVGLDYGMITLDNGDRIRLFGTPGQARFDFLWQILVHKALGLIILMDHSRPAPLSDLAMFLDGFASHLQSLPCVIGVGRHDIDGGLPLSRYADLLEQRALVVPILAVDVRQRADVLLLIDTLLGQIEAGMPVDLP